ncbi:MAG: peptide chain release factor N(5)-glutamine methyltransferase [Trueperaceae bacterium]|nr:MAG: peptide chain release factor N(5)-glutamine methyltransferase [Trueperaceae bacterium]
MGAAWRQARSRLAAAGVDSAAAEASWLLEAVTGLAPARQRLHPDTPLSTSQRRRLARALERRCAREPLQMVLGETEFYGLRLSVRPGVLVPRPETELLVEHALADLSEARPTTVIDVGTGGGAVALALAARRPLARIVASDVDPAALALARRNARALGLALTLCRADLLQHPRLCAAARSADLLVANLPYLPESDRGTLPPELAWESGAALFAGREGLSVARRLRAQAWRALRPGAVAWWELDARNAERFAREALAVGWPQAGLAADLVGRRRFVRLVR